MKKKIKLVGIARILLLGVALPFFCFLVTSVSEYLVGWEIISTTEELAVLLGYGIIQGLMLSGQAIWYSHFPYKSMGIQVVCGAVVSWVLTGAWPTMIEHSVQLDDRHILMLWYDESARVWYLAIVLQALTLISSLVWQIKRRKGVFARPALEQAR